MGKRAVFVGTLGGVFVVVVTGPPGVGKTSVLTALVDALSDDGVPHAAIEVEALRWAHPAVSDDQEMRHLDALCASYRQVGHDLLLLAQTIETDDDLTRLLDAAGADDQFMVRLQASPSTLVRRLVEREPEGWSGLPDLLAHTQRLAVSMPALAGVDLVLSSEGERPRILAERIRAACPVKLTAGRPPGS